MQNLPNIFDREIKIQNLFREPFCLPIQHDSPNGCNSGVQFSEYHMFGEPFESHGKAYDSAAGEWLNEAGRQL
jgi:hypothetical protein